MEFGDAVAIVPSRYLIRRLSWGQVKMDPDIWYLTGLETVYAHLSQITSKPGDQVEAGQLLGLGGRTGRATGSHLHFEVRYLGLALDSRLLINYENGELLANNISVPRSRLTTN